MDWRVCFFQEENGGVPFLQWLDKQPAKVQDKCVHLIEDGLAVYGNKLRRPISDYVEEGIYELRLMFMNVQYRILYFFHGRKLIVLSHGLVKKRKIPKKDLKTAIGRRNKYMQNPQKHTYRE